MILNVLNGYRHSLLELYMSVLYMDYGSCLANLHLQSLECRIVLYDLIVSYKIFHTSVDLPVDGFCNKPTGLM